MTYTPVPRDERSGTRDEVAVIDGRTYLTTIEMLEQLKILNHYMGLLTGEDVGPTDVKDM